MDRHSQNLERLLQKMQSRYGVDDDLVVQLKRELKSSQAGDAKNHAVAAAPVHRRKATAANIFSP